MFGSVIASPRSTLSSQQALDLANVYMRTAYNANNSVIALVLCHDAEVSLFQAKKTAKHDKNQTTIDGIATAYIDLGKLLERYKRGAEAKALCKKGEKLGYVGLFTVLYNMAKRVCGSSNLSVLPSLYKNQREGSGHKSIYQDLSTQQHCAVSQRTIGILRSIPGFRPSEVFVSR